MCSKVGYIKIICWFSHRRRLHQLTSGWLLLEETWRESRSWRSMFGPQESGVISRHIQMLKVALKSMFESHEVTDSSFSRRTWKLQLRVRTVWHFRKHEKNTFLIRGFVRLLSMKQLVCIQEHFLFGLKRLLTPGFPGGTTGDKSGLAEYFPPEL